MVLLLGRGSDTLSAPSDVRRCGEIAGIDPVTPVLNGEYVLAEPGDGCPMFEPVPCTSSIEEYRSICGEGCRPATAAASNGDTWLVGCSVEVVVEGPVGPGLEGPMARECLRSPYDDEPFWFATGNNLAAPGALPFFAPGVFCWPSCETGDTMFPREPWCPN